MAIEQHIDELVADGNTKQAVEELFALIKTAARTRHFQEAEQWRDKLIAVDSMALGEIISAAELIEEAKSAGIDSDHQRLWQPLLDELSPEEANAFFYALTSIDLAPGTPIIEQGKLNKRLFFITHGRVNVLHQKGHEQLLVYHIKEGETAGEDTFFGISVATATFVCHSMVKVRYLDLTQISSWDNDFPGLREKIYAFCKNQGRLESAIDTMLLDRRVHQRFTSSGKLAAQLCSDKGVNVGNSFVGQIADISQGGISFYINCSRQTAQLLLGRQLILKIFTADEDNNDIVGGEGIIVGVKYQLQTDYTVHVRFHEEFAPAELAPLVNG